MKRFYLWIATLLWVCILCGCQENKNSNIYDVSFNGKIYTVDQEQGTIICDNVVYQFEISGKGGNSVNLDIIYPDGSKNFTVTTKVLSATADGAMTTIRKKKPMCQVMCCGRFWVCGQPATGKLVQVFWRHFCW